MAFRNYLSATIFVILLIWGPLDHSWPFWLLIRIVYIILIPLLIWLLVGWLWSNWQPSYRMEMLLERIFAGLVCVALFILVGLEVTSKTHIGNTQWVKTSDGMEAVGDDIVLPGPDYGIVLIIVAIALLTLWFGVIKKDSNTKN